MLVSLEKAGKRYNRDWIFRNISFHFHPAKRYAIIGPNGSGKSTLLQVIASSLQQNEGSVSWQVNSKKLAVEAVYKYISIAAPYLDIIEEMTAGEFLQFHASFKPLIKPVEEIISIIGLEKAREKQIRFFSSGMKQRVKLAQAIFSDVPLVLLDEPCTNLDTTGYDLYHQLVSNYCAEKTVIVSSNDVNEYDFCEERIAIMDYK